MKLALISDEGTIIDSVECYKGEISFRVAAEELRYALIRRNAGAEHCEYS